MARLFYFHMLVVKTLDLQTANKIASDLPSKKDYLIVDSIDLPNRYLRKAIERAYIIISGEQETINEDFSYFPPKSFDSFKIKEMLAKFKSSKIIVINSKVEQDLNYEISSVPDVDTLKSIRRRYKKLFLKWLFKRFSKKIKFSSDYTKISLCPLS